MARPARHGIQDGVRKEEPWKDAQVQATGRLGSFRDARSIVRASRVRMMSPRNGPAVEPWADCAGSRPEMATPS